MIAVVLVALAFLCFCNFGILVKYKQKTELYICLGAIKINAFELFGKKSKKPKILSLYKQLEANEKAAGKKAKKIKGLHAKAKVSEKPKAAKDTKLLVKTVMNIIKTFSHYLKIKLCRIMAVIATDDAAKTAVTYGIVNGALGALYGCIKNVKNFKICTKNYCVTTDFTQSVSTYDIEIKFSIYGWQALVCLAKGLATYLKH